VSKFLIDKNMKKIFHIFIIGVLALNGAFAQNSVTIISKSDSTENDDLKNHLRASIAITKEVTVRAVQEATRVLKNFEIPPLPPLPPNRGTDEISIQENAPVEKKKVITKVFPVDAKNYLNINNQHGDVKVELWNKNEIKVDITIIGYGNTEAQVQALIDNVEIIERKEGDKIALRTIIDTDESSSNGRWGWTNSFTNSITNSFTWNNNNNTNSSKKTNEKRGVEINYSIFMPKSNSLTVSNKYGKTIIPQFSAPLKVTSNYGSFTSDRLSGGDKDIFVQYGSGNIKQMDDGDLHVAYSKLNIEKADNLKLTNNYGSVILDDINNLDGIIQYSSGKIGKINQSGKLSISYSDGVQLAELSKTLKTLDIRSNYTAVKLPVNGDCNADFEVTTTYANFKYPEGKCTLTVNPDDDEDADRKIGWQPTKVYKGKIGKGSATKITIKTNYAAVKFTEK
jgi:hypothetical protein